MDFTTFLSQAHTPEFWNERRVCCFVGNEYSSTWFNMLFSYTDKHNLLPAPYQRIFVESIEKKTLYATLNQSILGCFSFFWFGNLSDEKENKQTQELITYLLSYKGPHYIGFFLNKTSKHSQSATNPIVLPSELTVEQCHNIISFLYEDTDAKKMQHLNKLIKPLADISLDTVCMLLHYLELINAKQLDEYMPFLSSIMGTAPSLTTLAEHFWAKNTKSFFHVWGSVYKDYPDIFWLSFWSEQIWKAYHVVHFLSEKNFIQAKRMGFRLPYSFMNRDWQKTNTKELARAYEFLYHIDYALKTGSTFCSLDLFYTHYFTGKFAEGLR